MLPSLRFVMLDMEARLLAQNAWVDKPSPNDAAAMLETVTGKQFGPPRLKARGSPPH